MWFSAKSLASITPPTHKKVTYPVHQMVIFIFFKQKNYMGLLLIYSIDMRVQNPILPRAINFTKLHCIHAHTPPYI